MKDLRWNDIFELEEGDALSEEGYRIKVFKPDTTVLEMISAWVDYTEKCHVNHVRVLLINDKVFPSDYICYDLHTFNFLTPTNANLVPNYETWQSLIGKRVAKYGSFFRIPQDRTFFDLYLRLAEDDPKPVVVVKPNCLLKEWVIDEAIEKMNKQFKEGHVVNIPNFFDVIDTNINDFTQGPILFKKEDEPNDRK